MTDQTNSSVLVQTEGRQEKRGAGVDGRVWKETASEAVSSAACPKRHAMSWLDVVGVGLVGDELEVHKCAWDVCIVTILRRSLELKNNFGENMSCADARTSSRFSHFLSRFV